MDNSHSPPPKKFDRATMIAEARRALASPDTSPEDQRAALLYLFQQGEISTEEMWHAILSLFADPNHVVPRPKDFHLKMAAILFPPMPAWLKVGAYVFDAQTGQHGVLRQVTSITGPVVEASPPIALPEGSVYRKLPGVAKIAVTIVWGPQSFEHVENPTILPTSFAEMVQENAAFTEMVEKYVPPPPSFAVSFVPFPCEHVSRERSRPTPVSTASIPKDKRQPFLNFALHHERAFRDVCGVSPKDASLDQIAVWIVETGRTSAFFSFLASF